MVSPQTQLLFIQPELHLFFLLTVWSCHTTLTSLNFSGSKIEKGKLVKHTPGRYKSPITNIYRLYGNNPHYRLGLFAGGELELQLWIVLTRSATAYISRD